MEQEFTDIIKKQLVDSFGNKKIAEEIYDKSLIIQYIDKKTKSANKGSKSRGSFANLYAVYVIIEDYINKGFDNDKSNYKEYEGAQYSILLKRQRELPFGKKIQNHALNSRMNSEFLKCFPNSGITPIIRDMETKRYWFHEDLLKIEIRNRTFNIAKIIIKIIDEYIKVKQNSFKKFITQCKILQTLKSNNKDEVNDFIISLLAPNVDARLFEIISYSILKFYYSGQTIYWGFSLDNIKSEELKLFKTGRTNANDGGIDFVIKPLGRFFQVTETLDFKKYFLDIDKIEKYPMTFVIKSKESIENIKEKLQQDASKMYFIDSIVKKYMTCIEEIINIPVLIERFKEVEKRGKLSNVLEEIIMQSKVEFNYK